MNAFEVAVLRILIKRRQPLKLSALVGGFPDDCEDDVLSAISSLKLQGYIMPYDCQPEGYISINRDKRKEILQIVGSGISAAEPCDTEEKLAQSIPNDGKKGLRHVISQYQVSPRMRAITLVSLVFFGLATALGSSMPTTSPEAELAALHHHSPSYDHWDAYGTNDHGNYRLSSADGNSLSESPAVLKDCGQKTQQS